MSKSYAYEVYTPRGRLIIRRVGLARLKHGVDGLLTDVGKEEAEGTRGVLGEWDTKTQALITVKLSATREGNRVVTRHGR